MQQGTTCKTDKNKIKLWFSKQKSLITFILITTIMSVILIVGLIFDSGPNRIKKELERDGYNVDNIDFVLVDKGSFWSRDGEIYQSSTPIEYADGVFVNQWKLQSFSFGSGYFIHWCVKPYPEIPSPIMQTMPYSKRYDILITK